MNKNSKRLKKQIRKALKAGDSEIIVKTPVHNYHNFSNDDIRKGNGFQTHTVPVPVMGKDGVVSRNVARNMQMKVHHNKSTGGTASLTSHEPISQNSPVRYMNHLYILKRGEYQQPASFRTTT